MEQAIINRRELPGDVQKYIRTLEEKVELLQEELQLALFRKYCRSSEKLDTAQLEFFEAPDESQEKEEAVTKTVTSHKRKKRPQAA